MDIEPSTHFRQQLSRGTWFGIMMICSLTYQIQNIKESFFVLVDTFVVFPSVDCESVGQFCAHWPLWSEFPRIVALLI